VNVSLVDLKHLDKVAPLVVPYYESGISMGKLLALLTPGDKIGDMVIPDGFAGIATVCSITLNGILLSEGIPVSSIFGGLLEVRNLRAERFTAVIKYDGTSLDPLEIFIRSGMTDCHGISESGNGFIGASFREIPSNSRERVMEILNILDEAGLGGVMEVGYAGQPILDISIGEGRVGLIIPGGLNSVSVLEESGIHINSRALSGLVEYSRLFPYTELNDRIQDLLRI